MEKCIDRLLLTTRELEVADVLVERKAMELHSLAHSRQIAPEKDRENIEMRSRGRMDGYFG